MYNGVMDPELLKISQEQMGRIPPEEFARIQRQMMANSELPRLTTESMKNMRTEDVKRAAEQLKNVRTEKMVEVSEKMANASSEEIVSSKARVNAQMLKQQGNELHNIGKYHDAAKKYLLAKNNLKCFPSSKGRDLQTQCSLNLMSCYLKMKQFEDCIREGSEALEYDSQNVKAFYRRGQAYKEHGNLCAAVSDFESAHKNFPEDESIANVLRDAKAKLINEGGSVNVEKGLAIEEIVEDETQNMLSENRLSSSGEYSMNQTIQANELSQNIHIEKNSLECSLESFRGNPENLRLFQNYISHADPRTLEALGMQGVSPEMVKTGTEMISKMSPEELENMFQAASSSKEGSDVSKLGSKLAEISPEMIKMASDTISKMSPEELQKMINVASSLNNGTAPVTDRVQRLENSSVSSVAAGIPSMKYSSFEQNNSAASYPDSRMGQLFSSMPASAAGLHENMQNVMQDPAMRQMFASMMKNISPEMMANMSEQFGMKPSEQAAAKAQEAMSKLSPEDLDRMLRWVERAQKGLETLKKTKNWVLGRPGMILAILMLILAFIFHQLGLIGA